MSLRKGRLARHLAGTTGLSLVDAEHLVSEVLDLFGQTVDEFVVATHAELQQEGYSGEAIYQQIQHELTQWRFAAKPLSIRQIRRRIYG